MLVIRFQRTGRKGHSQFRVVVQDSRTAPSRGKVIAHLGSYNPHTKEAHLDKEAAKKFLDNGAQPSDRVIRLLVQEKVSLPKWVKKPDTKQKSIRNAEKLRRNQPEEEKVEEPAEAEAPVKDVEPEAAPAETEAPSEEPAEPETAAEAPAAEEAKPAEAESEA